MKFWGVLGSILGLYVLIEWGILGKSPFVDATQKAAAATGGASSSEAPPPASLFGISGSFSGFGESLPGVGAADSAGLRLFKALSNFAHDFNYGAAPGEAIRLPPDPTGQGYEFLGDNYDPRWGHLLAFRSPNDGTIRVDHVVNAPALTVGRSYAGGTFIGQIAGAAAGLSSSFWTGPHLGIVVDQLGLQWLNQLSLLGTSKASLVQAGQP